MSVGHIQVPNPVFDKYQKEPEKLAAWCWLERTRRYSDGKQTISISRVAGRFRHSRNWARDVVNYWLLSRRTGESVDSIDDSDRDRTRTAKGQARDRQETGDAADMIAEMVMRGTAKGQDKDSKRTGKGHPTKKQETRSKKQREALAEITAFTTPEWIPRDLWEQWQRVRMGIPKAAITELSMKLAVKNLERIRNRGDDPVRVLELAAQSGWQGIDASWSSTQIPARQAPHPIEKMQIGAKKVHSASGRWRNMFALGLQVDDMAGLRDVYIEGASPTITTLAGIPDSFWKSRLAWGKIADHARETLAKCGALGEGAEIVLKIGAGEKVRTP